MVDNFPYHISLTRPANAIRTQAKLIRIILHVILIFGDHAVQETRSDLAFFIRFDLQFDDKFKIS